MVMATPRPGEGRGPIERKHCVALAYRSHRGETYYLHRGTTSTGRARYFVAKSVGPEAVDAMPDGYEFCESVNGVVSVRRAIPDRAAT